MNATLSSLPPPPPNSNSYIFSQEQGMHHVLQVSTISTAKLAISYAKQPTFLAQSTNNDYILVLIKLGQLYEFLYLQLSSNISS